LPKLLGLPLYIIHGASKKIKYEYEQNNYEPEWRVSMHIKGDGGESGEPDNPRFMAPHYLLGP
jgi:hypothetical protein